MSAMIGQARGSTGMSRNNTSAGMGNKIPKGYEEGRLQQFTPEQMQLFQSMFSQLGPDSQLGKLAGGDQEAFSQLEAPAMQQFAGLQGGLASRFSGQGMGARRSSGFQNTANQATSDFASQLQSRRMDLQRQAQQDLRGMSNDLLSQKPYENFLTEKEQPWWQKLLSGLGNVGGQFAGGAASSLGNNFANKILPQRGM